MLKALIFDVDGTLAETEDLHRQAFNRAFAELGLDWNWSPEAYADLLTVMGGKERLAHYVRTEHGEPDARRRVQMSEIHDRKTRIYGDLVTQGALALRPGIARLVEEAKRAGLRLAVASTTSRPNIDTLIAVNFPKGNPFDAIACGDEAERKKPHPDVFVLALKRLGVEPGEAIASRIPPRHSLRPGCRPAGHRHAQPLYRWSQPGGRVLGRLRSRRAGGPA